jgi:hypothetical protein
MKLFSACIGVYRNRLIKAADRKELKKRIEKWHRLADTTLCQTVGRSEEFGGFAIMGSHAIGRNQNRVSKQSSLTLYIVMTVGSIAGLIYIFFVR